LAGRPDPGHGHFDDRNTITMGEESLEGRSERPLPENGEYLTRQLITYLGNKRSLLDFIGRGINIVQTRLRKNKLDIFDVFSGSGIVARYCKQFAGLLIVNDLEKYSAVINECYLSNREDLDLAYLKDCYEALLREGGELRRGIIAELYAPKDDAHIVPEDRVFYTPRNAMYIDTFRQLIAKMPQGEQKYFLAPLLSEASIHANTSGVFKGFYKNRETGIGQYGGLHEDAKLRITGDIRLPFPVFSNFSTGNIICSGDSNAVIRDLPEVDLAYLDPPYNQHPYGSNYFMLNLIVDYAYPENPSRVSGIPDNWNRSDYNRERRALPALSDLIENIKAKYVLLSFNSEGFIGAGEMKALLEKNGRVEVLETSYNAFRGSRNLKNRNLYVKEYLYLLEK
jgi:adenine-specific DNA-methyltransferase